MKCEIERMEINYTFYFFAFLKKVPYEKCDNCDRTAYQKAKEKCDNRKNQLEKKSKADFDYIYIRFLTTM